DLRGQPPRRQPRADLPQVVIRTETHRSALPELRPAWKIEVHEVRVRHRLALEGRFNRRAIIGPRDHPHLVLARELPGPIPAHARLGAAIRLAGVRREQDVEALAHDASAASAGSGIATCSGRAVAPRTFAR